MDLNTVSAVIPMLDRADTAKWVPGSAWLAGGSWLFSEPQVDVDTLLDLASLKWQPVAISEAGVEIAATCTFAQLMAQTWPTDLIAMGLVEPCCRALLGSFKIWNVATVGGNICLALPAGPMTALMTALDGVGVIWMPDGSERRLLIENLVVGPTRTALAPGEILRCIELPGAALRRRAACRRISLSVGGRSAALLIATRDSSAFRLTISGSTRRPIRLDFDPAPSSAAMRDAIAAALPLAAYHDDVHGQPAWRQQVTRLLAEELRQELTET